MEGIMMHGISVRTVGLFLAVGIVLFTTQHGICFVNSLSSDGKHSYAGYVREGQNSCGKFVQSMKNKNEVAWSFYDWVNGYLTAVNSIRPDTYDILGKNNINDVLFWIENYCKNNPRAAFPGNIMIELVIALAPNRITQEPADNIGKEESVNDTNNQNSHSTTNKSPLTVRPFLRWFTRTGTQPRIER
jgi:hypothetical protein